MRVAVIGAGALGRLYGVALRRGGADVSFVVRGQRPTPFVIERRPGGVRQRLEEPELIHAVPAADAALLCVRAEQIDESLFRLLAAAPPLPLVSLTPLLPPTERRLTPHVRGDLVPAMPAAAAELGSDSVVRYWTPPLLRTLLDSERSSSPVLAELAHALNEGGVPAALARGAALRNAATTIAFFPLSVALSIAGSSARLSGSRDLLELGLQGCRECARLAARIGPVEPGVRLAILALGQRSFGAALAGARLLAPELSSFLEDHFAHKLERQHAVLGADILELGREHGQPLSALPRLLESLVRR